VVVSDGARPSCGEGAASTCDDEEGGDHQTVELDSLAIALEASAKVAFEPSRGAVVLVREVPSANEETLYSEEEFAIVEALAKVKLARSEVG